MQSAPFLAGRLAQLARGPLAGCVSALLVTAAIGLIYVGLHRYDWGQPFTKLMCFVAIASILLLLRRANGPTVQSGIWTAWAEVAVYGLLLIWIAMGWGATYLPDLLNPPRVDVGYTTQNAALGLWQQGENPYDRTDINPRAELADEHRGFHYGPVMLLGYAATAVHPWGYKLTSALCLLVMLAGAAWVALREANDVRRQSLAEQTATALFVLTTALLCERFWYEIFAQGVSDVFPVALIVIAIAAVQRKAWFWAGLLLGLSFSSKFAPAVFLGVLLIRVATPRTFYLGGIVGLLPLLPFAIWEPAALYENVFRLRFILGYDSTSLYSITPTELHPLFSWVQLAAVLACLTYNLFRPVVVSALVAQFCLLLILVEVTFKEIHANHLIWFMPIIPMALAPVRHQLLAHVAGVLTTPHPSTDTPDPTHPR